MYEVDGDWCPWEDLRRGPHGTTHPIGVRAKLLLPARPDMEQRGQARFTVSITAR